MTDMITESLIRGAVITAVGISLYIVPKELEKRAEKRDLARILRIEINQLLNIIPSRERERIMSDKYDTLPNNKVYSGLLLTGNIRFFNDRLQNQLKSWYSIIDYHMLNADAKEGIDIIVRLEDMEWRNKSLPNLLTNFYKCGR